MSLSPDTRRRCARLALSAVAAMFAAAFSSLAVAQAFTANDLAIEPSGDVVVAGNSLKFAPRPSGRDYWTAFTLAAYRPDGSLDREFGSGGIVRTGFGRRCFFAGASGIVVDSSGRIVVAGGRCGNDRGHEHKRIALARYLPDGHLDKSFGTGGKVTTEQGVAFAVAIDPSGRIVVAGRSHRRFALVRYKANGSLDPTFGTGGIVTRGSAYASGVAIDPSGAISIAGVTRRARATLARYEPDGSLDSTFGTGGIVTTGTGQSAVAIDPSGRIVVAGTAASSGGTAFALARYDPNGNLDPSFGSGGEVTSTFAERYATAHALAIDSGGRLVVAGSVGSGSPGESQFAVARYKPDGSLDPSFGSGGEVTTGFGPGTIASARGVGIDPSGRIVIATGDYESASAANGFAVVRYTPTGSLDGGFGVGGTTTTVFPQPPPDTTISSAIIHPRKRTATFTYGASGANSFECALVSKAHRNPKFRRCGFRQRIYEHLTPGRYTFEVRALFPNGPDPTPARWKFRIR